jgi:NADH-quinone oxidoreductase subunit A
MPEFVGYLLLFVGVGVFFVFIHLVIGRLLRPIKPDPEKLTIYECGEPTIGSAWIQFDLRFYVVALLFVIFDVEVAFFFPWAVVFGKANELARKDVTPERRIELTNALAPSYDQIRRNLTNQIADLRALPDAQAPAERGARIELLGNVVSNVIDQPVQKTQESAVQLSWLAFWDILIFFGVLLVGYAYLWKRGDLDWVRSLAAERAASVAQGKALVSQDSTAFVGAGSMHS